MGCPIWYPTWFLLDLSGNHAPPLISRNRETSVCYNCHQLVVTNCIGSIWVLINGIGKFIGFNSFECGFGFDQIFLRFRMIFSTFLWCLIDPNAPLMKDPDWNRKEKNFYFDKILKSRMIWKNHDHIVESLGKKPP